MAMSIDKIKKAVCEGVKKNYSLLYKKGRKKVFVDCCVIEAAYPQIFVVSHIDSKTGRKVRLTFSYTDLLIKNVCLCPAEDTKISEVI